MCRYLMTNELIEGQMKHLYNLQHSFTCNHLNIFLFSQTTLIFCHNFLSFIELAPALLVQVKNFK